MQIEMIEDEPAPVMALTLQKRAAVALGSAKHEVAVRELVKESSSILTVTNADGREQAHRAGMKLTGVRVGIKKTGKASREDATKFSAAIIAEENRLVALITPEEDRIFALRDGFDAKVAEEKAAKIAAERARIKSIQSAISVIRNECVIANGKPIDWLESRLAFLDGEIPSSDFYEEFYEDAIKAHKDAIANVRVILDMAVAAKAEADRLQAEREAEAARLKAQEAENNRIRAELEAQRKAHAKAAKEAADKAAAELKAERDRQAAELAKERAIAVKLMAEAEARRKVEHDAWLVEQAIAMAALEVEREATRTAQAKIDAHNAALAEADRLAELQRQADALEREAELRLAQDIRNMDADDDAGIDRQSKPQVAVQAQNDAADLARCNATAASVLRDGRENTMLETWPERIYLQVRDDEGELPSYLGVDDLAVSWCADKCVSTTVEYVRADLWNN
jgi:hypothetical protein